MVCFAGISKHDECYFDQNKVENLMLRKHESACNVHAYTACVCTATILLILQPQYISTFVLGCLLLPCFY